MVQSRCALGFLTCLLVLAAGAATPPPASGPSTRGAGDAADVAGRAREAHRYEAAAALLREASEMALRRRWAEYELIGLCALVGDFDTAQALARLHPDKFKPVAHRYAITGIAARGEIDRARRLVAEVLAGEELQSRLANQAIEVIARQKGRGEPRGRLYSLGIPHRIPTEPADSPPPPPATAPVTQQAIAGAKGSRRAEMLRADALRLHASGNAEEARRQFERALEAAGEEQNGYVAVHALQRLGLDLARCGFRELSRGAFERAVALARSTPDLDRGMAAELGMDPSRTPRLDIAMDDIVLGGIARDRILADDVEGALETLGRIRESTLKSDATASVAQALALRGDPDRAAELLRTLPGGCLLEWLDVIRVQLDQGRVEAARGSAESTEVGNQRWGHFHVAYAWAKSGEVEDCLAWIRRSPNRDVRVGGLIGVAQALLDVAHGNDFN